MDSSGVIPVFRTEWNIQFITDSSAEETSLYDSSDPEISGKTNDFLRNLTSMDAQEKFVALQKAYADIILNISKEAAARVMSSERRAAQYQHELKTAKEEALRMLLRLKQMMDARTSEAEAAALLQRKKIEELEAQLQEAEDIVKDLREELGEVQDKLDSLKDNNLQNVNRSGAAPTTIYPYDSSKFLQPSSRDVVSVGSEITMSNPSQKNECSKCYYSKKDCVCSSNIRNQNLPSIILRDNYKEPGLHRNGRTQRIRACERNLLDKESCLSREADSIKDKNDINEPEGGGFTGKAPSPSFGEQTCSELENKLLADIKLSSFQPFRRKRKRATKQRQTVACLTTKLTDPFRKPGQQPELLIGHIPVSVKDDAHSDESLSRRAPIVAPDAAENLIHQGCEDSSGGRSELQNDEALKENMVQLGEETGIAESLPTPVCKVAVDTDDMPSNSLDWSLSDTTKGLPCQPMRERIIKYTFQRKHKRGVSSGFKRNVSLEMEKRNGDKKIAPKNHEPSMASLSAETSRDSRRLAQVARQLISLSEKKWWN